MLRMLQKLIGQGTIRFARETANDQLPTEDLTSDGQHQAAQTLPARSQHAGWSTRATLCAVALFVMTLAAYAPVLSAGFIWDDHENLVENETLFSREGLRQVWFVPQSIPQYCPLTYTSYWIEYSLWELAPRGYHLTNILLHGSAVILAWRLLVLLRVPGAWFAAALFAVHPVEVESVAWITERKNVLSLPLVLLSMLCYLRFAPAPREDRIEEIPGAARWKWYAMAFALFALALAAKTVVVTMPAVILVIYWWKRGRVTWPDVACILPFAALAVAIGLIALQMEEYHRDTQANDWALPATERLLLAGRALWFYGGKLFWPHPLVFFYPHWTLDDQAWWQYLWPLAALLLLVALWAAKGRLGRGPLAAVGIFVGVLAPTLSFVQSHFMKYAYVSDHFQYHASLAIIALTAAAATLVSSRLSRRARGMAYFVAGLLLFGLGSATFQQTYVYRDLETLYRDTIAKNPRCTTASSNLAVLLSARGDHEEAIGLTRSVLDLDQSDPIAHINLGLFLLAVGNRDGFQPGQLEETIDHLRQGLKQALSAWGAAPDEPRVRNYLGYCLMQTCYSTGFQPQVLDEIIEHLNEATRLAPDYVDAHVNLALALAASERQPEAIQHAARAIELEPHGAARLQDPLGPDLLAEAHVTRGAELAGKGEFRAAEEQYRAAIELRPDHDRAMNNLGVVLMNQGRTDEAIRCFEEAVHGDPKYAEAKMNLEKARQVQSNQDAQK